MQRSYNKYGDNSFEISILEYCDNSNLLEKEQFYIDLNKNSYNILKKANNSLGYKHTEETKNKLKKAWQKNPRKNTKEQKEKISKSLKGRIPWNKGKTLSNSHIKNMITSRTGQSKCSLQINKVLMLYKKHKTFNKLAENTDYSRGVLKRFLIYHGYNHLNPFENYELLSTNC